MITIRQLAKEVGLAPATISMVLNSSHSAPQIPAETQRRVHEAAKRLGYSPNPFARYLRSSRSGMVAILLSDITDPYCAEVLKGLEEALYSSNYIPVLVDVQNSRTKFRHYLKVLVDRRIEGLICVANSLLLRCEMLAGIKKHGLPTVMIGRGTADTGVSSVSIENEVGGGLALEHLYQLGHRKIAVFKGPKDMVDSERRWQGIAAFARDRQLSLDSKLVLRLNAPGTSYEAGFATALELLNRKREFTALLAFDDLAAFGAIRAFTQRGLHVPGDCSVIGFDDVTAAAYYNPPLTTIQQPMKALAASAAELFFDSANAFFEKRPHTAAHRQIKPVLVERESTAALIGAE